MPKAMMLPLNEQLDILCRLKEFALNIGAHTWKEAAEMFNAKNSISEDLKDTILWYGKILDVRPDLIWNKIDFGIMMENKRKGIFRKSPSINSTKINLRDLKEADDHYSTDCFNLMVMMRKTIQTNRMGDFPEVFEDDEIE